MIPDEKLVKLQELFGGRADISMAFIFGSHAKGQPISESDVDVAVYFKPVGSELEWEEDRDYDGEDSLWLDIEKVIERNTDFVVLNRAPSGLASEILRTGIPIIIKDRNLYWRFFSLASSAAEDFRKIIMDWWAIKERSRSLTEEDRIRLVNVSDFLAAELKDLPQFKTITQNEYQEDSHKRRELERLVENIINASIDMAKITLGSQKERLPDTYAQVMLSLNKLAGFDKNIADVLAEFAKLRNLLTHEYLDIRFSKITKFLESAERVYGYLSDFAKNKLK